MNDYISRQAEIDYISRLETIKAINREFQGSGTGRDEGISIAVSIIADMPSADVVEVVRCEKCCYAKPFNEVWSHPKRETLWCSAFMEEREPEWFCAGGERRTDGEIH